MRTSKTSNDDATGIDEHFSFGPYRLLPRRRLLLEGDTVVRLGSRALAILTQLVGRAGETISKEELLASVWPDTAVDEANLRVHIAALRKALGDGRDGSRYIANLPVRGYCFVAPVTRASSNAFASDVVRDDVRSPLPAAPVSNLIGRDATLAMLGKRLESQRLITIVGPAGIGKTAVARAVGAHVANDYPDGVRFVDLATISDPRHVVSALAGMQNLSLPAEAPMDALVRELAGKIVLILLDNCEHVIDAAADLSERLLANVSGARILATSRESLRAQGESVYRLPALELPPETASELTAAQVSTFSAVALFVERARASLDTFELTDADAPVAVDLCRRLDGVPLAIELAAARVDTFGLRDLTARLDGRFRLLMRGHRTAIPRQQTLRGAMEWSYETLSPRERWLLRRLAVFRGIFTFESVLAITEDEVSNAVDELVGLVAKSLVSADVSGAEAKYRLLATTRAYAFEKLVEAGETAAALRSHALYVQRKTARMTAMPLERSSFRDDPALMIDDVRAALDWGYSEQGEPKVAIAITIAAASLAAKLSLHAEFRGHVTRALEYLARSGMRDDLSEMKLSFALGCLTLHTRGGGEEAFRRAYELASKSDVLWVDRAAAIEGVWANFIGTGEYPHALELAEQHAVASAHVNSAAAILNGERVLGLSLHYVGEHARARPLLEGVIERARIPRAVDAVQIPSGTSARVPLARTLWIQGLGDSARNVAAEAVAEAMASAHRLALCLALGYASIPIAIWCGDTDEARRFLQLLVTESALAGLEPWKSWGRVLGLALDQPFAGRIKDATAPQVDMLSTLRTPLVDERALARAERGLAGWCAPEVFRATGEELLRSGTENARDCAEGLFLRARDLARGQGALSWELRAVTSLARLWSSGERARDGRAQLAGVFDRITEGATTQDVIEARRLLDAE
ncbi:Signal transduction response regulator / Tetratricopeptide repeat-containing protein [Labilithrix luteola]|uniref:Signal transduction response regulator / Tetratricopeptide repeat-containing protein n=1 Tax=Labilithrix luteola TaxID=1391654 RepID=A0A0K1PWF7_9BACT|nr:Signal transduction response regulator / Tetratricopeptide repeat-containing protein [Labilithrix luteola]